MGLRRNWQKQTSMPERRKHR